VPNLEVVAGDGGGSTTTSSPDFRYRSIEFLIAIFKRTRWRFNVPK